MVISIHLGALIIQILALYKAFGLGESRKGCIISFLISLGFIGSLLGSVGLGEAFSHLPSVAWGLVDSGSGQHFEHKMQPQPLPNLKSFWQWFTTHNPVEESLRLKPSGGDNLSQIFLWLTGLLMPLCILGCGKRMDWAVCLLLVEGIVSLAFSTENLLVFFIAFETVLLPMFVMVAQVEQNLQGAVKPAKTYRLKKAALIIKKSFTFLARTGTTFLAGVNPLAKATRAAKAAKAEGVYSSFEGVSRSDLYSHGQIKAIKDAKDVKKADETIDPVSCTQRSRRKNSSVALSLTERLSITTSTRLSISSKKKIKDPVMRASEIAAFRLYLYTLTGSFCMLVGVLVLYWKTGSFNWQVLTSPVPQWAVNPSGVGLNGELSESFLKGIVNGKAGLDLEKLVFPLIFIGLAVKVPLIPVHLWLPFAHTMAPTAGSMVLAGLLLKLGGYGMVKWLVPMVEEGASYWAPLVCGIALLGALASSLSCIRGLDVKGIIAYSSIVHMNTGLWGIFGGGDLGRAGAVFDMVSHGVISAGLFFAIGVLYNRYHSREVHAYGGLAKVMPLWSGFFFLLLLGNLGLPLTSGFVGEFLILLGGYKALSIPTILMGLVTISNAAFCLLLFKRVCLGELTPELKRFKDLSRKEGKVLLIFGLSLLILGIKGNFLLDII